VRRSSRGRLHKRAIAAAVVALLACGWGWMLWKFGLGEGLRQASYDLPYLFHESEPSPELALVFLDEGSFRELGQPLSQPLDRRIHAELIERLRQAGARTVVFDILFADARPEQDPALAEAMRRHGGVVLAGEILRRRNAEGEVIEESLLLATPELRRTAAGSGLTEVPLGPDGVVRQFRHRIPTPFGERPSLALAALRDQAPKPPPSLPLVKHYGPSGTIPGYRYSALLLDRAPPEDAFRDRIVMVGSRQQAGLADAGKDTFPTPYTKLDGKLQPGVELQATAASNLLRGDSILRLPESIEWLSILGGAAVFAAVACLLPPLTGVPLTLLLGLGVAGLGAFLHIEHSRLFLWSIPAFGQAPLAAALALGAHYIIEYGARWRLRRAFRSYLSD